MKLNNSIDILHLDGSAGFSLGALLFVLHDWVGSLYVLPSTTIYILAIANLSYGVCALLLAFSKPRNPMAVSALAIANAMWALVCVAIIALYIDSASLIGLTFVGLEGGFVLILAIYEWHNRKSLAAQPKC